MNFYMTTEPMVQDRHWANLYMKGAMQEVASLKGKLLILPLAKIRGEKEDIVIVNSVSEKWTTQCVRSLLARGMRPAVLAPVSNISGISTVSFDFYGAYRMLIGKLMRMGARSLCFIGAVITSYNDREKIRAFTDCGLPIESVFVNEGDLSETFAAAAARLDEFDGILFPHDLIAYAFYRQYANKIKNRMLSGISNTDIADVKIGGNYIGVPMDCIEIGRQAVMLCSYLARNRGVGEMHVRVGKFGQYEGKNGVAAEGKVVNYYRDARVNELLKYQNMLSKMLPSDKDIIKAFLSDKTYTSIAFDCFISVPTVKYRLKRMSSLCGFSDMQAWKKWLREMEHG